MNIQDYIIILFEFVYFKGNCHIYEEHLEAAKIQLERIPYEFPTINIKENRDNINDYIFEDFDINGYSHHEAIKLEMIP